MNPRDRTDPSRTTDLAAESRASGSGDFVERVDRWLAEVGMVFSTAGERRGSSGTEAVLPNFGDDGVETEALRCGEVVDTAAVDSAECGRLSIAVRPGFEMMVESKQTDCIPGRARESTPLEPRSRAMMYCTQRMELQVLESYRGNLKNADRLVLSPARQYNRQQPAQRV